MLNADLIVGFSGLILAGVTFLVTRDLGMLGGIFVDYVVVVITLLSIVMVIKGLYKPEKIRIFESIVERNNILAGLLILVLYLFFMPRIGFLPSSYLFYAGLNLYLGDDWLRPKNIAVSVLLSGFVVTGFFLIFKNVLGVPLPQGSWFFS